MRVGRGSDGGSPRADSASPASGGSLRISRREAMRLGFFGAAGLVLAGRLSSSARAAPLTPPAKAKAVIQIWMWGGPPPRRACQRADA